MRKVNKQGTALEDVLNCRGCFGEFCLVLNSRCGCSRGLQEVEDGIGAQGNVSTTRLLPRLSMQKLIIGLFNLQKRARVANFVAVERDKQVETPLRAQAAA